MNDGARFWKVFLLYVITTACIVAAMTSLAHPWTYGGPSIYGQTFLVGDTARSLVEHRQMEVCSESMGTPGSPICFRAARMPVPSATLALGAMVFGDRRPKPIVFAKNLLYLLPFWAAAGLTLWQASGRERQLLWCALLLTAPLLVMVYSGTIVNVDAEEGYLFGLLGLGLALFLWQGRKGTGWVLGLTGTLNLLFLCKSSMLGVVAVLGLCALLTVSSKRVQVLLALLLCVGPLGWGLRQKHVTGRFSFGTSLDGINLEKGNNAHFLERYPATSGSLDAFDSELNSGVQFRDEWKFNDYHVQRAREFIRMHPQQSVRGVAVKTNQMLFTLDRHSRSHYGSAMTAIVEGGFILFRLLLWLSIICATYSAATGGLIGRLRGAGYLLLLAAYYAPYIAGFGYARHAIMPLFPAVLLLCSALLAARSRTPPTFAR